MCDPVTVKVYSAGSLGAVIGALNDQALDAIGVQMDASFGGSGTLRQKIEADPERPHYVLT